MINLCLLFCLREKKEMTFFFICVFKNIFHSNDKIVTDLKTSYNMEYFPHSYFSYKYELGKYIPYCSLYHVLITIIN